MFACNSGVSRQFDTYLMDKGVMQILEGKDIPWTKDIWAQGEYNTFLIIKKLAFDK